MNYLKRLNLTAEETALESNKLTNEQQSICMSQEIFDCKREAINLAKELNDLKNSNSLNFKGIVKIMNMIAINKNRKAQLAKLQKELFSC